MTTCSACGGDGECKNEFHTRGISEKLVSLMGEILTGAVCPACGSDNTELGGKCSVCGGTGEVSDDD